MKRKNTDYTQHITFKSQLDVDTAKMIAETSHFLLENVYSKDNLSNKKYCFKSSNFNLDVASKNGQLIFRLSTWTPNEIDAYQFFINSLSPRQFTKIWRTEIGLNIFESYSNCIRTLFDYKEFLYENFSKNIRSFENELVSVNLSSIMTVLNELKLKNEDDYKKTVDKIRKRKIKFYPQKISVKDSLVAYLKGNNIRFEEKKK